MTHRQVVGVAVRWAVHGLANLYRLAVVPALHQKASARRFHTAIADADVGLAALLQAAQPKYGPGYESRTSEELVELINWQLPPPSALSVAWRQLVDTAASARGTVRAAASTVTTTLRSKWFRIRS
jgi:hypothetical protein